MKRRRFLASAATVGLLAGCSTRRRPERTATEDSPRATSTPAGATTGAPATATEAAGSRTIVVDRAGGSEDAAGTAEDPLWTIQGGLDMAQPGDTVRLRPGRYFESPVTARAGEPDAPITVTGPPEAVVTPLNTKAGPNENIGPFAIEHSHVHVRGLTFDGRIDPESDEPREAYSGALIEIRPPIDVGGYIEHVVVKPDAVGYSNHLLIGSNRANHVEVGEFEVIGPAGLAYSEFGQTGHVAEIVYIGTALPNVGTEGYPDSGIIDRSHDWHVHHIDNSAGHRHAELVDVKAGSHDVLVEYCTDYNSGFATDKAVPGGVGIPGHDCTVRWCDISRGEYGVKIGTDYVWEGAQDNPRVRDNLTEEQKREIRRTAGTGNSVYGNRLLDHQRKAIAVPTHLQSIEDQDLVCGNEYNGDTDGDPDAACRDDVPTGDGVGYTGGDSPWG